ncbi:MAG: indole-3-glycerol phosphate synthase TrpC [Bacteroidales bacterium]|nr:indole-3-glycerol phosphate synthase TrpC [Bacteroidales bacterium]
MNILQQIASSKRREVESAIKSAHARRTISMSRALREYPCAIIAEFKRRSPSRGDIAPGTLVTPQVQAYEAGGAAACSILTDTPFFGGALSDLQVARQAVTLPLLRKDFIIDALQIAQAAHAGADAVLLIASLLSAREIASFTDFAHRMGLEVLLEIHDASELKKVYPEADMIGVNNRNLTNFDTTIDTALELVERLPEGIVRVAESGIHTPQDLRRLRDAGFDAFLIGEALMRAADPTALLQEMING